MSNEFHPGQRPGSSPDLTTPPNPTDRLQQVARLFADAYSQLLAIASDDPRLSLPADPGQILDGIERQLSRYSGSLTEPVFLEWATSIILPQRSFYGLKRETERSVYAAIWRTLGHAAEPSKYDDYPELVKEIGQEVWLWVFEHIDELSEPGKASLTTRLYARAKIMTRGWLKKHRTRWNAVIRQVYGLPSVRAAQEQARLLDKAQVESAERQAIRVDMEAAELAVQPD